MSSHWVAVKPNHSTSSNKELMDKINKKIDEQIECYELNVNGAEDDYIKANLKLIKDLAQNIKNSDDIRSIEKIISTFCEIMDIQRETIHDLSVVYTQPVGSNQYQHNYVSSYVAPVDGFTNDEQIKSVFINFMVNGTKKKRSSFTANDYILNTNSKKFHKTTCSLADDIGKNNKENYTGSRDTLIQQGYEPCKSCNP